jgi:hypothetical protein
MSQERAASGILAEDRTRRNAPWAWLLVGLMIAGGVLLRWPGMVERPLWIDEAAFWLSSRAPLLAKLTWTHHYEHPPLAYMIEGWMFQLFGDRPEWLVRIPSFVFGLSCIPFAFLLGRAIGGNWMGVLTAALATVDPVMVEQAHQARMYSQFQALLLLTLLAAITLARNRSAGRLRWAGLGVLEAALYWTSQAALAAWAGQLVGLFWIRRSRAGTAAEGGRTHWGLAWTVALVLSSIGLFRLVHRLLFPIINPEDITDPARLTVDMANTLGGVFGRLGLLLLPLALVGLWSLLRERPIAGRLLAAIAGLNLAGLVVLRTLHPLLKSRYLVALLPAVWVGAAAFVVFGPFQPRVRRIAFVLALAGVLVNELQGDRLTAFVVSEDIRALHQVVAPGDAIVYLPSYNFKIGSYYGLPPSPPQAADGAVPPPAALDGRRVWLVSGTLPAERYVREARELMLGLAERRGTDASRVLGAVTHGYTGVVSFDVTGPPSAWRLEAGRWWRDPAGTP